MLLLDRFTDTPPRTCLPTNPTVVPSLAATTLRAHLRFLRRRGRPATMPRKASSNSGTRPARPTSAPRNSRTPKTLTPSAFHSRLPRCAGHQVAQAEARRRQPFPVQAAGRPLRRFRLRRGRERRRGRAPRRVCQRGRRNPSCRRRR